MKRSYRMIQDYKRAEQYCCGHDVVVAAVVEAEQGEYCRRRYCRRWWMVDGAGDCDEMTVLMGDGSGT